MNIDLRLGIKKTIFSVLALRIYFSWTKLNASKYFLSKMRRRRKIRENQFSKGFPFLPSKNSIKSGWRVQRELSRFWRTGEVPWGTDPDCQMTHARLPVGWNTTITSQAVQKIMPMSDLMFNVIKLDSILRFSMKTNALESDVNLFCTSIPSFSSFYLKAEHCLLKTQEALYL